MTDKDAALREKASLETVTAVQRWTDNLFTFRTTRPADYRFIPGQYSRLGLPDGEEMLWRAYSITSAPAEDELEYYSTVVPGGAFTTQLKDIQPGDKIWIDKQRFGFMTAERFVDGEDLWMLATGTGLGPYISVLRDPDVWCRFRNLIVVHGARHVEELAYTDEILALQQHPPVTDIDGAPKAALHLIQAVTREQPDQDSGILSGRITTLLESGELEQKVSLPFSVESSRVMLCGNPAMIEDGRRILQERGMGPCRRMTPGQFVTENYW